VKKPKDEWQTVDGEIVTVGDCIEALELAQSLIVKELESNKQIRKNNKAKTLYGRYKEILGIMKHRYLVALKEKRK